MQLKIVDVKMKSSELVKSGPRHNKAAHRDAQPLTSFAVAVAHGLKH